MLTKEQRLALPKKRANRAEMDAFYALYAALSPVIEAAGDKEDVDENGKMIKGLLADRAKLIPGGYRNLRLIETLHKQLVADMKYTFEPEKQRVIEKQSQHLRLKTVFGKEASKDPEMFLLPIDDLAILIRAATGECKLRMCLPSECARCSLGKVIDGASFVSRGNRAWWEVFGQAERGVDVCADDGD